MQLATVFVQLVLAALQAHQQQQQQPDTPAGVFPSISGKMLLQYLPLPGEVQDHFLGKAAAGMLQLLQQQPCVLTESGRLARPASTLLPQQLLQRSNRQPLISNDWLKQGLPELDFVHPDILSDSRSGKGRAARVLRQLGTRVFDASMLISWLQAAGTHQLLRQLPTAVRVDWLKELYKCLNSLMVQPANSNMSLADVSRWGPKLAAAPILQLFGSRKLVCQVTAGEQLYLWDESMGSEQEMKLFTANSSNSTSSNPARQVNLQFVDPASLNMEGRAVLRHLLGVHAVQMTHLVQYMLQLQATWHFSNGDHLQQLLFMFKNRSRLRATTQFDQDAPQQLLAQQLCLRKFGDGSGYSRVWSLHTPLAVSSNDIPAELCDDLTAAGVQFPHPQYLACSRDASMPDGRELWSWFRQLGMQQLTPADAAMRLLNLYSADSSRASIRLQQHMQHSRFMAAVYSRATALPDIMKQLDSKLQGSLYLYSDQNTNDTPPAALAGTLSLPLSARYCSAAIRAGVQQQLKSVGVQFVNPCYHEGVGDEAPAVRDLLQRAGVQRAGPIWVSCCC